MSAITVQNRVLVLLLGILGSGIPVLSQTSTNLLAANRTEIALCDSSRAELERVLLWHLRDDPERVFGETCFTFDISEDSINRDIHGGGWPRMTYQERLTLLAWHRTSTIYWEEPDQPPKQSYKEQALVHLEFTDKRGNQLWGLALMDGWLVSDTGTRRWKWEIADYRERHWRSAFMEGRNSDKALTMDTTMYEQYRALYAESWYPIIVFNHPPTNVDIYGFIHDPRAIYLRSKWGKIFTIARETETGECQCCQPCRRLAEGHVYEESWKRVVGEAPTEFYNVPAPTALE